MKEKIEKLQSVLGKLSPRDAKFAADLIGSFYRYKGLTPKQAPWVDTLIGRAEAPKVEQPKVNVGGFEGVIDLFKRAQQHLKYPKIVLQCAGEKVILSVAGPQSKAPGSVNVAGEGYYPNRKWFGRVSPDGQWEPSASIQAQMLSALQTLLTDFSNDPASVAQKHGQLTGNCCFCNTALTDERSTAVGFGPVCAKHYGLEDEWKAAKPMSTCQQMREAA
jgi:hypothetical protein